MYMSRSTQLQAPKKPDIVNTHQAAYDYIWNEARNAEIFRTVDSMADAAVRRDPRGGIWTSDLVQRANQYIAQRNSDAAINKANAEKYQRDVAEYNSWKESTTFVADARARELASRNASNPGAPTSRASLLGMGTNMLTEAQRQASVLGAHNALEEQKRQKTLLSKGW